MLCWQNTVVKVWLGTKTTPSGFQKYLILLRRRWLLNVSTPKILKPLKVVVPAQSPPATDMKVSYDSYKCWFDEFKDYFTDLWFEETYNFIPAPGLRSRFSGNNRQTYRTWMGQIGCVHVFLKFFILWCSIVTMLRHHYTQETSRFPVPSLKSEFGSKEPVVGWLFPPSLPSFARIVLKIAIAMWKKHQASSPHDETGNLVTITVQLTQTDENKLAADDTKLAAVIFSLAAL